MDGGLKKKGGDLRDITLSIGDQVGAVQLQVQVQQMAIDEK